MQTSTISDGIEIITVDTRKQALFQKISGLWGTVDTIESIPASRKDRNS